MIDEWGKCIDFNAIPDLYTLIAKISIRFLNFE